eukprot:TRINITY_DN10758_c0_g1_i1.p1 TRINITY_DN10758_c0_g1~~TRINITY_DN10758_c0_g1_i1.p1  ORF type:complete len:415 (+),score=40.12 TRINITY_DN10758_c0_g1_i1:55-1299(+)
MTDFAASLTCNITDPLACSKGEGHGECLLIDGTPKCRCLRKYDPVTDCDQFYTPQLGASLYLVYAYFILVNIVVVAFMSLELHIDRRLHHSRLNWKSPLLLVKIFVLVGCLFDLVITCTDVYEDATLSLAPELFRVLFSGLNQAALTTAFVLGVVNWVGLLLKVKSLGGISRHLIRFRKASWIILLVFQPLHVILFVLTAVEVGTPMTTYIDYLVSGMLLIPVICVSGFFLIKVFIWASAKSQSSQRMKQAVRKTIALGVVDLAYIMIFVRIFSDVQGQSFAMSAWPQFIWLLATKLISSVFPLALFFFAETDCVLNKQPMFSGYVRYVKGVSILLPSSTRGSTFSSTKSNPTKSVSSQHQTVSIGKTASGTSTASESLVSSHQAPSTHSHNESGTHTTSHSESHSSTSETYSV